MANEARHIIRKQVIDLTLPNERQALDWQRRISKLYQNEVIPALDKAFAELELGESTFRIPRLEIDLGTIQTDLLEKDFPALCIQAIIKQVKDKQALQQVSEVKPEEKIVSPQEAAIEHFFFFLENGTLPWNARGVSLSDIQSEVLTIFEKQSLDFITILKQLLNKQPEALRRLVRQFPNEWLETIISQLLHRSVTEIQSIIARLKALEPTPGSTFTQSIYEKIFQLWSQDNTTEITYLFTNNSFSTDLVDATQRIKTNKKPTNGHSPEEKIQQDISSPSEELPSDHALFIDNAGLVLLAPYLQLFFEALQLTENNAFVDRTAQERAVHLLQYVITKTENPEEHLLPLNKILCNLPLQAPIERFLIFTDEEKEECEHLLNAVIRNWGALGNTSPDGLREGFLKRTAKLSHKDDHWLLQVERKAIDILLDKMPWGFNIIKLPWMQTPLYTEWV